MENKEQENINITDKTNDEINDEINDDINTEIKKDLYKVDINTRISNYIDIEKYKKVDTEFFSNFSDDDLACILFTRFKISNNYLIKEALTIHRTLMKPENFSIRRNNTNNTNNTNYNNRNYNNTNNNNTNYNNRNNTNYNNRNNTNYNKENFRNFSRRDDNKNISK